MSLRLSSLAMLLLGIFFSPTTFAASCCAPPSGVVASYPGDGTAEDVRGGNDGTLNNGAGYVSGKVGQAFSFDGVNDILTPMAGVTIGNQYTVEAWLNPSTTAGGYTDATLGSLTRRTAVGGVIDCADWSIGLYGGKLGALFRGTGGGGCPVQAVQSPATVDPGAWYHVALTSDGTTARFYVNGVEQASGAVASYTPSPQFRIGGAACCSGDNFAGLIDEVTAHDRALSAAEVQAIYEAGDAGKCSFQICSTPAPGLKSWYRMQGNSRDAQGAYDGSTTPAFATGKAGSGMAAANSFVAPEALSAHPQRFTFSAWVTSAGGLSSLPAYIMAADSDAIELETHPDNSLRFVINGVYVGSIAAEGLINNGQFHHVAGSYDGSQAKLYLDGVAVATTAYSSPVSYPGNSNLYIGTRSVLSEPWPGVIDEAQVYDRALTATEIREIFNAGASGVCADCVPVLAGTALRLRGDGNAQDASGLGHAATLQNGATASADGFIGQAFSFDGSDDRILVADHPSLKPLNVTASAWVNFDQLSGNATNTAPSGTQFLIFKSNTSASAFEGYALTKGSDNRISFVVSTPSGTQSVAAAPAPVVAGRWYHLAGSFDGAMVRLYVDGALAAEVPRSAPMDFADAPLFIGSSGQGHFDGRFWGRMDEVQIHGRALSAAEIARIYSAGSRGFCSDSTPDAFSFPHAPGAVVGSEVKSRAVTISGIDIAAPISVVNGDYRINGGAWTSTAGTVSNGQTVQLRLTAPATPLTVKRATVSIGGVSASFQVQTSPNPGDNVPDVFDFVNTPNAPLSTVVKSRTVTPAGYNVPATVSIVGPGCEYRIDGGAFSSTAGSISPTQTLQLRTTTSGANATKFQCDVTVGAVTVRWIGKTLP